MLGSKPINLDESSFDAVIRDAEGPVLVDFWAGWCQPCLALAPTIEALAGEFEGRATVAKVDVDQAEGLSRRYGIRNIPTVLVFSGGEVVAGHVGVQAGRVYARSLDDAARVSAA